MTPYYGFCVENEPQLIPWEIHRVFEKIISAEKLTGLEGTEVVRTISTPQIQLPISRLITLLTCNLYDEVWTLSSHYIGLKLLVSI